MRNLCVRRGASSVQLQADEWVRSKGKHEQVTQPFPDKPPTHSTVTLSVKIPVVVQHVPKQHQGDVPKQQGVAAESESSRAAREELGDLRLSRSSRAASEERHSPEPFAQLRPFAQLPNLQQRGTWRATEPLALRLGRLHAPPGPPDRRDTGYRGRARGSGRGGPARGPAELRLASAALATHVG